MKITIICDAFPPLLDGVGDYSFHLATEFQKNGHFVSVLCRYNVAVQEKVDAGDFSFSVRSIVPAWNYRAVAPLRQYLNEFRPDWVLWQYVPNSFDRRAMPVWLPLLLWLIKQRGSRLGIMFHEVQIRLVSWPLKYTLVALVERAVVWTMTQLADRLITSIDLYKTILTGYTNKPVELIPIGSNIPAVAVSDDELAQLRQRIAPNGEAIISTFGLRNQDLLLDVFAEVVARRPDVCLLICGALRISDAKRAMYERMKAQIYITGYLPAPDVYRHLKASDVFFLPDLVNDKDEGGTSNKSGALASALLAGLPVVGTKGDMNNRLLLQTPGVLLEDSNSADALSIRVLQQLDNSGDFRLHEKISSFSDTHLAWERISQFYLNSLM